MILIDDKLAPPPPYTPRRRTGNGPKFSDLPQSIVLQIVEATFPTYQVRDSEDQRRILYWLTTGLRLVNRSLYIASMHTLRSTYFETYISLVQPPYTSDPFPFNSTESCDASALTLPPIKSLQRETEVFDLFIALKAREDVWIDETVLHLEREESFKDLFFMLQPRRRLEDLLREYGVRYGCITLSKSSPNQRAIPFSRLNISYLPRKIGVVLITPATRHAPMKRTTILECARMRDEKLEVAAKRLAKALHTWVSKRY